MLLIRRAARKNHRKLLRAIGSTFIEPIEPRILLSITATDDQIVYHSGVNGSFIKISNSDGTGTFNVPVSSTKPSAPAFSPDRTRIVFTAASGTSNSTDEIWTIGIDGSSETRLTNNSALDDGAHFSPDGTHIVFVSNRDGNDEIYSMNADGTNQTRLTNNAADDTHPSYSPDGSMILFQTDRDGNNEIYTMNADGTNLVRRTNNAADDVDPAWSPEGQRIAFASNRVPFTGSPHNIFVLDVKATLSGPAPVQITPDNQFETYSQPSFSPDGTKIAVSVSTAGSNFINVFTSDLGFDAGNVTSSAEGSPNWASAPRFAGYANGVVTVVGTSGADKIVLGDLDTNGKLPFTLNGKTETFTAALINQVQVFCGAGNDTLDGSEAPESIYASGDAGDDELIGGISNDTLTAGAGRNTLFGGDGDDRLNGSGGRDFLYGENGNDREYGNAGNDYMVGGAGVDRMWGGDGDDLLSGNTGNDKMYGEAGNDQLIGGDGNDICNGGLGIDTLNGQKGTDTSDTDNADVRSAIEILI